MMRRLSFLLVILAAVTSVQAQKEIRKIISRDNSIVIFEIGAVITAEDGQMAVLDVMNPADLPGGGTEVDIQSGDRIMMFNGKKVETIKDLRAAYDEAEVGKTSKLGFKRSDELRVVEFKQMSPDDRPQKVMIRKQH